MTTPDARTREFLQLLGEHDASIQGFILSLVPHWADAHEIAQDVRLRLWEQFDEFNRELNFGRWACTIAYYSILTFRKSSRHHQQLSDDVLEMLAEDPVREVAGSEERHRALRHCLDQLSSPQSELLMRYYAGNHTLKEIAEQTHSSFNALRQRVLRARKAIALCIERRLRAGGSA